MRYTWAHVPPEGHQPRPVDNTSRYVYAQVSRWYRLHEPVHPEIAMEIASWYHSPNHRDRAITAFASHGEVMLDDLAPAVRAAIADAGDGDKRPLYALLAYVEDVVTRDTRYRTLLSTSHGHRMMGCGDGDGCESCLTCGGHWLLRPDLEYDPDGGYGSYFTGDGEPAGECSGDTSREHGYPGERHCQAENGMPCDASVMYDGTGPDCAHIEHDCNCVVCR